MADLTITGIPTTIKRKQVLAAIEALGLDATDIRHLSVDLHNVHVEIQPVARSGEVLDARCQLRIPITDG